MYINTVFAFYGYLFFFFFFFLNTHLYCLVGCFSMIVWTNAVLGVFDARVLNLCFCTCSAQLSMLHMERRSRNTISINVIVSD